jgi:hypothetical protein
MFVLLRVVTRSCDKTGKTVKQGTTSHAKGEVKIEIQLQRSRSVGNWRRVGADRTGAIGVGK